MDTLVALVRHPGLRTERPDQTGGGRRPGPRDCWCGVRLGSDRAASDRDSTARPSMTSASTRHGEPLTEARSRLISVLREVGGPDMTSEIAQDMLQQAHAWESVGARQLATYLSEHDDAFIAPSPHIPLAMATLFTLLADNGFGDQVVLPRVRPLRSHRQDSETPDP